MSNAATRGRTDSAIIPIMTKRTALYLRVSSDTQTVENQRLELEAVAQRLDWHIVEVLADEGISGAKGRDKRPGYDKLMKMVARKEIDLIACWSVDRLGRSLQHLVTFLGEINERGVDLYLHTQGLDTSTAAGRAMFSMLSVFSEFERAILTQRIKAGLARSTKRAGRPRLDPMKVKKVEKLLLEGVSLSITAKKAKVGVGSVSRIKARMSNLQKAA
jgi:DNA invertase Pin-like site-specific DNA recombinase